MVTYSIFVDDESLRGLDPGLLEFTWDGATGTQLRLDNVAIKQVVPEPSSIMLSGMGIAIMLLHSWKMNRGR